MTNPPFDALLPVKSGAVPQNLKLTFAIDTPTSVGGCRICGEVAGGRRECVEAFGQSPTVECRHLCALGSPMSPSAGLSTFRLPGALIVTEATQSTTSGRP